MMKKYLTLLAASSFAFFMQACGDDSSSASADPDEPQVGAGTLYFIGSDYKTGEIRWVANDTLSKSSLSINQDSKLVSVNSKLFALERYGSDNLALVDTDKKSVAWEVALESGANPSDLVAINEDEGWLAYEGIPSFAKISLKDGKVLKTVETSAFATKGATSPNLVDFEVKGDTLLAIFQRYVYDAATWTTTYPNGLLAMYKLSDGSLLDTVQLAGKNPNAVAYVDGAVYVSSMGDYSSTDDCGIEKVDLSKKTSAMVIKAEKLGTGVYNFAVDYRNAVAYAVTYKMDANYAVTSSVAKVNLAKETFEKIDGIKDAQGGVVVDPATTILYVGSRADGSETIYAYDGEVSEVKFADEKTLAPYGLAIVW